MDKLILRVKKETYSMEHKHECKNCGKTFCQGEEGDNEEICLRCERISIIADLDDFEHEELDIQESVTEDY